MLSEDVSSAGCGVGGNSPGNNVLVFGKSVSSHMWNATRCEASRLSIPLRLSFHIFVQRIHFIVILPWNAFLPDTCWRVLLSLLTIVSDLGFWFRKCSVFITVIEILATWTCLTALKKATTNFSWPPENPLFFCDKYLAAVLFVEWINIVLPGSTFSSGWMWQSHPVT